MQIIRIEDNVRKSRIDGTEVAKLPKGLRIRMVRLLNKLDRVKRISIAGRVQDALFEFPVLNTTLEFFHHELRKEFVRTIELLVWYLAPHWSSMSPPDVIGGEVYCMDCNYMVIAGGGGEYCPNSSCLSHKKWRMVIGPSYEPPKADPCFPESLLPQNVRGRRVRLGGKTP